MPAALGRRLRPTEQQRLLLRCALGDDETVRACWAQLRRGLDFDDLDEGSHGLLPLVYRALVRAGVDDPLLGRLKGIYRKAWFGHQVLMAGAGESLEALGAAGADPLLLHGAALSLTSYPETGLRRTPFVDVAVLPGTERRALSVLGRAGWVRHPDAPPSGALPVALVDREGRMLVLHSGLPEALHVPGARDGAVAELWARARRVDVGGGSSLVLEPTDQLLCVLAVGPDVTLTPQAEWLADATMLVRRHDIDWVALRERARERRVIARVTAALRTLEEDLGVVTGAGRDLLLDPGAPRESLEYRLYGVRGRVLGGLPQTLSTHVRRTADAGAAQALVTTPRFLAETWGLESPRGLPRAVVRKALRRPQAGRPAQLLQRSASSRGS